MMGDARCVMEDESGVGAAYGDMWREIQGYSRQKL